MGKRGSRSMSGSSRVMHEHYEGEADPKLEATLRLLREGCANGECEGGILSAIITPRDDFKIIFTVKDADGSRSFDKIFAGKRNLNQRNLIAYAIKHALEASPVHEGGIVVVGVERTERFLEVTVFDVDKDSLQRIKACLSHQFGFSIFSNDGHLNVLKIEVPRNWV